VMSWPCSSVDRLRDSPPPAPARTGARTDGGRPSGGDRAVCRSHGVGRAPDRRCARGGASGRCAGLSSSPGRAPERSPSATRALAPADGGVLPPAPVRPEDSPLRHGRRSPCPAESRCHGCREASAASGARQAPAIVTRTGRDPVGGSGRRRRLERGPPQATAPFPPNATGPSWMPKASGWRVRTARAEPPTPRAGAWNAHAHRSGQRAADAIFLPAHHGRSQRMNHREENDAGRPEPGHATDETSRNALVLQLGGPRRCVHDGQQNANTPARSRCPRGVALPGSAPGLRPQRSEGSRQNGFYPRQDRGGGLSADERDVAGADADPAGDRRVQTIEHVDLVAKDNDAPSAEWDGRTMTVRLPDPRRRRVMEAKWDVNTTSVARIREVGTGHLGPRP